MTWTRIVRNTETSYQIKCHIERPGTHVPLVSRPDPDAFWTASYFTAVNSGQKARRAPRMNMAMCT
jgi:hypothetical protein